jgi:hypothetical protein
MVIRRWLFAAAVCAAAAAGAAAPLPHPGAAFLPDVGIPFRRGGVAAAMGAHSAGHGRAPTLLASSRRGFRRLDGSGERATPVHPRPAGQGMHESQSMREVNAAGTFQGSGSLVAGCGACGVGSALLVVGPMSVAAFQKESGYW